MLPVAAQVLGAAGRNTNRTGKDFPQASPAALPSPSGGQPSLQSRGGCPGVITHRGAGQLVGGAYAEGSSPILSPWGTAVSLTLLRPRPGESSLRRAQD